MEDKTYIIGHKNPDADAICSALAYEALKHAEGFTHYKAARCGNINARINTILQHFDVSPPTFLGDVTPRINDILIPADKCLKLNENSTYAEALTIIDEHDIRALPVVNKDNEPIGIISIFQLGEYFIPKPSQTQQLRHVQSSVNAILKSLNGEALNLVDPNKDEELFVRVGAMDLQSFNDFTISGGKPEQCITVVSNRKDIQEKAIEMGVRLLVVTGGRDVDPEIIKKAKNSNINLIKSRFDVAATTWIIRSATPITATIQRDITTFSSDEKLSNVRRRIANHVAPIYFVTNENGKFAGIFSKSDILKPVKTKLALVDHNEISQAVDGADEVNIVEIIDHHRLGNRHTRAPIRFYNEPVGSTSTIIATMFRNKNITPPKEIAGIMMGGIITDTLNLNSPTTTDVDREILPWLGQLAGITPDDFSEIIFNSGSVIVNLTPPNVIESDCKIFSEGSIQYSASQVEELGFSNFWEKWKDLLNALEQYRQKEELTASFLLVTDINTQNSLLMVTGNQDIKRMIKYPAIDNHPIYELKGVVSRKKQLIPYITSLLADAGALSS